MSKHMENTNNILSDFAIQEGLRIAYFESLIDKHNRDYGTNFKCVPILRTSVVIEKESEYFNKISSGEIMDSLDFIDEHKLPEPTHLTKREHLDILIEMADIIISIRNKKGKEKANECVLGMRRALIRSEYNALKTIIKEKLAA